MKPVKPPRSRPLSSHRGRRRGAVDSTATVSAKRHARPDKKLRVSMPPIATACHFKAGDAVVWLRTRAGEYGHVAPMLGRVERVVAGQCSIRVYSASRKSWVNSTVPADELDVAAAHEVARLLTIE